MAVFFRFARINWLYSQEVQSFGKKQSTQTEEICGEGEAEKHYIDLESLWG